MKHEFKARPAFLSRDDRIIAHFMTCFLALILYRYLEKKLDCQYTVSEVINTLRDMNLVKIDAYGYIPAFTRTVLTDALHETYGWTLSKELTQSSVMRGIIKNTKNRK